VGNLFARGEIVVREDPAALVLPAQVVERTGNGSGVVLLAVDGRVVERGVHVDAANRDELALSGLEPGVQVIVPGAERLTPGERVEVVEVRGARSRAAE
jgi:multidrug efflux pump subunit AcrA (membrane-fusion protein)